MDDLDKLKQFFLEFQQFYAPEKHDVDQKMLNFWQEYLSRKQKLEHRDKTEAPMFNIFSLLGMERDETKTHTMILANLLDPTKNHGQKELFLYSFLKFCRDKFPETFPTPNLENENDNWNVYREFGTGNGRVDIVIQNHELGFAYVIENKIDASEQSEQLNRYGKWLESIKLELPFSAMLFLTPDGRISITASKYHYYRLAFKTDIYSWLGQVIPTIKAESVRQVVIQYRNTISRL